MLSSYYSNSYGLTSSILNDEDSGYDTSSQPSMASSMHYYQMSVGIHPANNGMHVGYPFPRTPHHHNHYPQNHPHFMAALSGSVDRVLRQPPHHFGLQKDGQRQKVARATKIPQAVLHAADLLCRMLNANPDNRPTASQVLSHPFFSESGDWFVNTRQGDIDIWKDEIREAIQDSSDPHHGLATSSKSQYTYNGIETFNSDVLASPVAAGAIGNGNSGGGGDKDMHASAARTTTSYADDALSDDSCYFAAGMDIDAYLRYCD
ncbi:hypothetical protein EV182_004601 [Spiromyces aspiralis]|uniref:Uncharacterized protein n=1 Tax=Spiromyces aspiralis TaxID=68401 RepID=A0ACC1HPG3_9FUNG|nr:hypothetical protein EV182_004601 [Spiromyces aspiralis]